MGLKFEAYVSDPDHTTGSIYTQVVLKPSCDGSTAISSSIGTQFDLGVHRQGSPSCTTSQIRFGYAGCDTYLTMSCPLFGNCNDGVTSTFIYALSPQCRSIGLSCLRKVEEIVSDNCLPDLEYYVLPMKLPNRCVTQQNCLNPTGGNQFYKALGFTGPLYR